MKAAYAAALVALLLPARTRALDAKLTARPELDGGSIPALALSFGPDRPVCGRVTFERRQAILGGRIFAVDSGEAADEDAVRLSRAVVARRGGSLSRAAIAARRHGVPAVAVGRGSWDAATPSLTVREPQFGARLDTAGFTFIPATSEKDRVVREGDAVCVDAAAGRLVLPTPTDADAVVDAAQAAEAFDGLRDVGALERWLADSPSDARSTALMAEMISRIFSGEVSPPELERLARASRRNATGAARERRAWQRAAASARAEMTDCAAAAEDAPSAEILSGLTARAGAVWDRASAVAKLFGGDEGVSAAARSCLDASARRRRTAAHVSPTFAEAAAAAGASKSESVHLPAQSWSRFLADNSLSSFINDTVSDASFGLRRKSALIKERILAGRISPGSELGVALAGAAAACPCLIIGADAVVKAASERAAFDAVKEAWAASWQPGPLGARLRAGEGARFDGAVEMAPAAKGELSGLLYSRDPASARRHVLVAATAGPIEGALDGSADFERWVLEPTSGRALDFSAAAAGGKPLLSTIRLKALARLARALDAWKGGPVEIAFTFDGSRLKAHHARALETPRPLRPLRDPFSPRPDPQALDVKSVR